MNEGKPATGAALAAIMATAFAALGCAPQHFEAMDDAAKATIPSAASAPPATKATERFAQNDGAGKVDVLIIDDNSLSMDVEQSKMATRFASFISALSDVDYHIGVTTTDLDSAAFDLDGALLTMGATGLPYLLPTTPGANAAFLATIQRSETAGCADPFGLCPSGNEQPLLAVMRAIARRDGSNAGFFRPLVDLAVVILSDEDEQSTRPAGSTTPTQVIAAFQAAFGTTKRLQTHAIVVMPGDAQCLALQNAQDPSVANAGAYGTAATELAILTGGTVSSICADDYAANLSSISQNVRGLVSSFELARAPLAGSVIVRVTSASGAAVAATIARVDGKRVWLASPPPAGSVVEIEYAPAG